MSKPFLRFEDAGIIISGQELLASKASLSLSTSLNMERQFGEFDPKTGGATVDFVNFAPSDGLVGQLQIEFMVTPEHFNEDGSLNSISRMFKIAEGMSDQPINTNVVGRYAFDNMYLKSFSFSLKPFSIISASASYDIYGTITRTVAKRMSYNKKSFAHGLKSFGNILVSGQSADSAVGSDSFEISSLDYSLEVNRQSHHSIRRNEHTSINTNAGGAAPTRMSVQEIICRSKIIANEMIPNLNSFGDQQDAHFLRKNADTTLDVFLNSLEGERIASFTCSGKISSQESEISEGSLAKSVISLIGVIR